MMSSIAGSTIDSKISNIARKEDGAELFPVSRLLLSGKLLFFLGDRENTLLPVGVVAEDELTSVCNLSGHRR